MDQWTKKIVILQDNDENQLLENLKSYVNHIATANNENDQTPNDCVVENSVTNTESKQSECQSCKTHSDEISKIINIISEIKSKLDDERQSTKYKWQSKILKFNPWLMTVT